jgi:hypothetical protein
LEPYLSHRQKQTQNILKSQTLRLKIVKVLEKRWDKLFDIGFGNDFLQISSESQAAKAKLGK